MTSQPHRPGSERGAVLITAMIISSIMALTLASYIALNINSLRQSLRSSYQNSAINLNEMAVEEAIWSLNKGRTDQTAAWADWLLTGSTSQVKRKFSGINLGANTTAVVKTYVYDRMSDRPKVVAWAEVTPAHGPTLSKWLEITLQRRSLFTTGLVARKKIKFKGATSYVDSWNSIKNDDGTPRSSPVAWSVSNRRTKGSIGSVAVEPDSVSLGNGEVYGTVGTGGSDPNMGNPGTIADDFNAPKGSKNTALISKDFSTNFETVTTPVPLISNTITTVIGNGDAPLTLPRTGDLPAANGVYYYKLPAIDLSGSNSEIITIGGNKDVVLLPTAAAGTNAIKLTGNAGITISTGSSLQIYTAGEVILGGGGVVNSTNQAVNFQLYGTSTSNVPQQITYSGTSEFTGVIYATNGDVEIGGNVSVSGSIVGNNITLNGNVNFHYDESLADLGADNPYGITQWRELIDPQERAAKGYIADMNGW